MKTRLSSPAAKEEVTRAIQAVESQTAAELVVAMRPRVADYRHIDYLVGFVASLLALLVFLFYPADFDIDTMPVEALVAFGLGVAVSAYVPPVRRLLISRERLRRAMRETACTLFIDLGVSKTTGRTGVFVLVAGYERRVEVLTDVGVPVTVLGPAWQEAITRLGAAVRASDLDAFVAALRELGPALGRVLPRTADDVNELSDEVA